MNLRLKKIIAKVVSVALIASIYISGTPTYKVYADMGIWNYGYTGGSQSFTVPYSGTYTIEGWGASGGTDGPITIAGTGGYAKGNINLIAGQTLYIYAGGKGADGVNSSGGGFNGGGNAGTIGGSGGGGGATDFRLGGTTLSNRILVAGGGGGSGCVTQGANGGGLTGDTATYGGRGGSQSSGGSAVNGGQAGSFGQGGSDPVDGGGGGGGYYGGGSGGDGAHITLSGTPSGDFGGGGGSSYIGGVQSGSTLSGINTGNGYAKITYLNPILNVSPNNSANSVDMNWSVADTSQPYSYMIYSKDSTASAFQTIPAKSKVKVLNIYPTIGVGDNLKSWMETPNSFDSRGFGRGDITVEGVDIDTFNNNPEGCLKLNGTWKYDVIMFGSYDGNGGKDINQTSKISIENFIKSGRGVLFGHDTILSAWNNTFNTLKGYLNIDLDNNYWSGGLPYGNGTIVKINKKGLLTNYPWNIGDVNTSLTIPYTHDVGQIAYGDIWMKFTNVDDTNPCNAYLTTWNNTALIMTGHSGGVATPDEQKVLANTLFYLGQVTTDKTWTDHKGQDVASPNPTSVAGISTNSDNTQFTINYNSVTDNGSTYDYYAEATGETNNIKLKSETKTATITTGVKGYAIKIDQNPTTIPDKTFINTSTSYTFNKPYSNGTNFYVHVASVDGAGNMSTVSNYLVDNTAPTLNVTQSSLWSNNGIVLTVTGSDSDSGIKYIKTPDGNYVTTNTASFIVNTNGVYNFECMDNVGNITRKSIVLDGVSNGFEKTAPMLSVNPNTTNWVSTLNAQKHTLRLSTYAWNIKESPVTGATYLDGNIQQTLSRGLNLIAYDNNFNIIKNVTYDTFGDVTLCNNLANDINSLPNGSLIAIQSYDAYNINDNLRNAFKNIGVPNATTMNTDADEGIGCRNQRITLQYVTYKGDTMPLLFNYDRNGYTNADNTILVGNTGMYETISSTDTESKPNTIILPNGSRFYNNSLYLTNVTIKYLVFDNGTYNFKTTDGAGNSTSKSVVVNNIDNILPILNLTKDKTDWSTGNIVITASASDGESGISQIQTPDGKWTNASTVKYTATINGDYQFSVKDVAGNITTKKITISNIDKEAPTLTLTQNSAWTNGSTTINIKATDTISGVKQIILPDGNIVPGDIATYTVSDIGVYYFRAIDNTGNIGINYIVISNIDKNKPAVIITNNKNWSKANSEPVTITATDN